MDMDIFMHVLQEAIKDKDDKDETDNGDIPEEDTPVEDNDTPEEPDTEEEPEDDDFPEQDDTNEDDTPTDDTDNFDDDMSGEDDFSGEDTDNPDEENTDTEEGTSEISEEDKIKSYNLLTSYIKLYNMVDIILDKLSELPKSDNDEEISLLNSMTKNNNIIKRYIYQYICFKYSKNTYAENLYNFYQFKSSLELSSQMIEKIYNLRIKESKDDKQLNK